MGDEPAAVQDDDAVGSVGGLAEHVAGDKHRPPVATPNRMI
jgi:hypothetical protein